MELVGVAYLCIWRLIRASYTLEGTSIRLGFVCGSWQFRRMLAISELLLDGSEIKGYFWCIFYLLGYLTDTRHLCGQLSHYERASLFEGHLLRSLRQIHPDSPFDYHVELGAWIALLKDRGVFFEGFKSHVGQ